jgi:IS5 family transposase
VLRTVNDQPTLWESLLPAECLALSPELARVDALLDDPVFFAPFRPFFDPAVGRPSIPVETYLRLMFLKVRYRLGYESLCREVADSISWQRFCRIPLGARVPHPTTLMKITTRCGDAAVAGLNEALLAKAADAKLLRTDRVRADTTVVEADVAYPTDSGLLAKAVGTIARTVERIKAAGGATRTASRDRRRAAGQRARSIGSKLKLRGAQQRDEAQATVRRITGELADLAEAAARDAAAVVRNARRALRHATGRRKGRLRRALDELTTTIERTAAVVTQTRTRLAGEVPGRGDAAGQPARSGRPPDPQGPARAARRVRLQSPARRQRGRCHPRPHRRRRRPTRRADARPRDRADRPAQRPCPARGHRRPRLRRSECRDRPARPRRALRRHPPEGETQRRPPRHRTPASVPQTHQVAHRIRRTHQLRQTQLRLEPHPTDRHRGRPDLVRTRRVRPQPRQDRSPRRLTRPRRDTQHATSPRTAPTVTPEARFSGRSS